MNKFKSKRKTKYDSNAWHDQMEKKIAELEKNLQARADAVEAKTEQWRGEMEAMRKKADRLGLKKKEMEASVQEEESEEVPYEDRKYFGSSASSRYR